MGVNLGVRIMGKFRERESAAGYLVFEEEEKSTDLLSTQYFFLKRDKKYRCRLHA
jgi:hypothetical protein